MIDVELDRLFARQRRMFARATIACAAMLSPSCGGCQPEDGPTKSANAAAPDEAEEETPLTAADVPPPADYADAVKRLDDYHDAIRRAIASGHFHDAHRPLDETNIALERLPAVAKASGVPRRDWEAVVTAGDDLGEALASIHDAIDAGRSPDYETHAPAIDGALQQLRSLAKQAAIKADSPGTKP